MKKYVKFLLLAFIAMTAMNATAAGVDAAAARLTASRFVQSREAGKFMGGKTVLQLISVRPSAVDARLADYYVFNTSGGGFVVVAGDDRAHEVLAYGDQTFDPNDLPCNLQWLLDLYSKEIDYLHANPDAQVQATSPRSTLIVEPLLPCSWSQGEPYNEQCPIYKGQRTVTGCVATAMAQVMYYWKYPAELPELIGYTTSSSEMTLPDLPAVTLDWDNMLDDYRRHYAPEHGSAVATLMRYCGQACYMNYGTDGSGADCKDQVVAMRMFKYNPACRLRYRNDYDAAEWGEMMQADLAVHRPILYAGFGDSGGHAFVIDGFDGSKYHINWGWAGTANGYFVLDAFDPAGMSFSSGQQMINELYPFEYGVSTDPYDFEAGGIYYKKRDGGVTVVNRQPLCGDYSGQVVIPSTVSHGGETYKVTGIGNDAFRKCSGLTAVTIPATVKRIGKYAFMGCTSLTTVNIPPSVNVVDYGAFMDCMALSSVSLANGLKEIGYYAFANCLLLKRISVPNSVTKLGENAFYGCLSMERATIGNGVDAIPNRAFASCAALTDVSIGNGAHIIYEAAFLYCRNLKNLTIGSSMDSIGENAFKGCTKLTSLTMWPELPPLLAGEDCFEQQAYDQATVYVIDDWAMEDYRWAEVWIMFNNFALIEETPGIYGDVNGDGEVTVADVNAIIDFILGKSTNPACDVNGDGEITIADVNAVINIILAG